MARRRPPGCLLALIRRHTWKLAVPLVAASAYWAFGPSNAAAPSLTEQARWMLIEPQRIEQQLGLVGRIQAARQQTLAAPFEGVIREVLVQEGQVVEAGQPLLRLDPAQIHIQLRQAQAQLLKAEREAHQLRHWRNSPEVARARRTVQTAGSALQATQANLRDTRALFERGIVARMEVDTLAQQVQAQRQELTSAEDELRTLSARGDGEERHIAEMELANAQARFEAVARQSERQTLKAPFAGVVVRPQVEGTSKAALAQPGVQVTQGAPLLSVIGLGRLQVLARVEEADLHQLHEQMPVHITGDGFAGQTLNGHITGIAVQGNATDALGAAAHYDVVVSVDAPQAEAARQARLGMSARLAIILYENDQGIVVPPEALEADDDGKTYVMYRASLEAAPVRQSVKPGRVVAQGVEIQGVRAGYVWVPSG
ncbi:efflux RND transporter periplasmic adaptor subunit [Pseudomonas sp. KNUC1026]|uniref:efflux RND transporter periplasmic adaptor subunit n=1 Tax=Pseudomonas sp. KNUC1026 TaxID=2893890 RepID=UPI001F2A037E|nr:HlyD family efflux transporter periplasmic adaptor subunit [Pseudomonas sp. KNUC1026]UFH50612.1 HlyD family efflux transporter periplasmic adaptor subunit [Pseudomonas sp. KNUC1026]